MRTHVFKLPIKVPTLNNGPLDYFLHMSSLSKITFLKLQELEGRSHTWLLGGSVHQRSRTTHSPCPENSGSSSCCCYSNWTPCATFYNHPVRWATVSPPETHKTTAALVHRLSPSTPSKRMLLPWPRCLDCVRILSLTRLLSQWQVLTPTLPPPPPPPLEPEVLTSQAPFLDDSSPLQTYISLNHMLIPLL